MFFITKPAQWFESSVNSYDSQTAIFEGVKVGTFESSVNSYDSQTVDSYVARDT